MSRSATRNIQAHSLSESLLACARKEQRSLDACSSAVKQGSAVWCCAASMAGASVLTRAKLLEAATFKEGDVRVQVVELLGAGRGDVEKLHTHKTKSAHHENGAKNCKFRLHHTTLHSPRP